MEQINSWGYHLMVEFAGCDIEKISSYQNIYNFIKELVPAIDMVAFEEPRIVRFGKGNKAGYTLDQLIMTSNICAHYCEEDGAVYLDVFSCKPFDPSIAIYVFKKYFDSKAYNHRYIQRQAPKL
jgi:S-adenosylmethionine/arginine decarboxylase-like enzyme